MKGRERIGWGNLRQEGGEGKMRGKESWVGLEEVKMRCGNGIA